MDRRTFLQASSAGLGLGVLNPGLFAAAQAAPLRVALIGCGWYGKADLLRLIQVSPGNLITAQTVVTTVQDSSQILVNFWVPERFSNKISVGQEVSASAIAIPGSEYSGVIQAVDNRVDEASRTLRVRARLDNPDDTLRAGMSFSVVARLNLPFT